MNIEILIGREVEGASVHRIPPTFKKASRKHAVLHWQDGVATIEDKESANGTFVNGKRIAKTKVTENDTVWLGGNGTDNECYQLDMHKVFATIRDAENSTRTDYTKEFARIKQAYINYQTEVAKLKQQAAKKSQMPRLLATLIPAVIGLIITIVAPDPTLKIVAMSLGSVISGVVGILTLGKSSASSEKLTEEITELQIKYQKDYRCPKCGKDFNMGMHWKKLEAGGKCPFGCGAEFVKK